MVSIVCGVVLLIGAAYVVWYFAHGDLVVTVEPGCNVVLKKGNSVVTSGYISNKKSPAKIFGENSLKDSGKLTARRLFFGTYTVELKNAEGYADSSFDVKIGFNAKKDIIVKLTPLFGSVKINSMPPLADVFVSGKFKGKTPLQIDSLPAKSAKIRLKMKDMCDLSLQVVVPAKSIFNAGLVNLIPHYWLGEMDYDGCTDGEGSYTKGPHSCFIQFDSLESNDMQKTIIGFCNFMGDGTFTWFTANNSFNFYGLKEGNDYGGQGIHYTDEIMINGNIQENKLNGKWTETWKIGNKAPTKYWGWVSLQGCYKIETSPTKTINNLDYIISKTVYSYNPFSKEYSLQDEEVWQIYFKNEKPIQFDWPNWMYIETGFAKGEIQRIASNHPEKYTISPGSNRGKFPSDIKKVTYIGKKGVNLMLTFRK